MTPPPYGQPVAYAVPDMHGASPSVAHPVEQRPMYVSQPMGINKKTVSMLVILGIILFYVGTMIATSTTFLKAPNSSDYDNYDDYTHAYQSYLDNERNLYGGGRLTMEIGALMVCLGFFGGGVLAEDLDLKLRVVFITSGIAMTVTFTVLLNMWPATLY